MNKKNIIRIILDLILVACASVGLWWLIYPVGILGVCLYKRFYEFIFSALLLDIIYGVSRAHLFGFVYFYTLISILIFIILLVLKTKIRPEIWQKTF